ncbi:4-hydroxythreonine-4-phosphate dehydrogenase [Helicobacter sp. 11S02596-1]|uniref:4-hydroxythreonine-4-phosphate dehydrogenase n=1 Tax=Helicobacter sp. 11S02596-1 TaxID=1476194 RepID=UPI000BA7B293|nr:4-hydroxythreonine-4-phosphate dehydrogenase [Helicobacter sp. 11S02596-1]PAF44770.1 4-hydroxythreonine-4-phosphate dehydrogenase [Helicobacter sp. 11S02596-1]
MKKIAISIGDINGVGPQLALSQHETIKNLCEPIYCAHPQLLQNACELLGIVMPNDMVFVLPNAPVPPIRAGEICPESGRYSYKSFLQACTLADKGEVAGICTLPIHKKAWQLGGITAIGHTEVLANRYEKKAIMMLGCKEMFVALFSDHIALKNVNATIKFKPLCDFLIQFYQCVKMKKALVLGLNPHCGDGGLIGDEDTIIAQAIIEANKQLGGEIFIGPIPPDTAFSPQNRQEYRFFISMYHDVGLAPLKALYFYESINITLNIPILRTSVDHGVAFNIAYKTQPNPQSYLNAIDLAAQYGSVDEKNQTQYPKDKV